MQMGTTEVSAATPPETEMAVRAPREDAAAVPRIAWGITSYVVPIPGGKGATKRILDACDGGCAGGEMKMILGPSGSGKTSLLSVIAGHLPRGRWEGEIFDDGAPAGRSSRRTCGFVVQHSMFFWCLSARETLTYQARLRRPRADAATIRSHVDRVLGDLDLLAAAETHCGDERHKGLSGGERRRLTIAQELLADPGTLLADEPTSGLDAATALLTIATLARVCKRSDPPKAVVAVIHQPRRNIFDLFDSMLVLCQGHPVYYGRPGAPLETYLGNLGFELPPYENPGDFLLDLIAVTDDSVDASADGVRSAKSDDDNNTKDDDVEAARATPRTMMRETTVGRLVDDRRRDRDAILAAFPDSDGAAEARRDRDAATNAAAVVVKAGEGAAGDDQRQGSWPFQFSVLLSRALRYKLRDETVAATQISMGIVFALILGAVFFDTNKSVESVTNRIGAISFSVLLMAFIAFDVVILFPRERDLYRREARAGLHTASAFFQARCVAEVPSQLFAGFAYACVVYWMIGFQRDSQKFLVFLAVIELEVLTGTSVLIACGCLAKDFEGANNLATLFICLFLLFDGHYINNNAIPKGARWIKELNYLNHGISAIARNEFIGLGDLTCKDDTDDPDANCPFDNGGQVVDYYGFDEGTIAAYFWKLALIMLGWRAIAFLAFSNLYLD